MSAYRELYLIVEGLDVALRAKGLPDNSNPETRAALMAELAADVTGFAVIDDYEARLGLNMADERAALVEWHADYIGLNLTPAASAARTAELIQQWEG
jgi:hypothetical protein